MKLDPDRKAHFLFGAVIVVGALVALGWYIADTAGHRVYQITTADPVSGLIVDAPVEFHGVDVGKVKRVELTGPRSVSILLAIRDSAPVTAATVATITSRGLATRGFTGYVYISLEDVGEDKGPIATPQGADYPVIRTAPSRMVNLDLAVDQVNRNVQRLSHTLESQVLPQLQKTLTHVDNLVVRLNDDPGILIKGAFRRSKTAQAEKAQPEK
jgi:phospholipid/cholesterol/gamma-HCH transport system substrate-binding protein